MPVFHTKTIESILDPVAQQVRAKQTHRESKKRRVQNEKKTNFPIALTTVHIGAQKGNNEIPKGFDRDLERNLPVVVCR